MHIREETALSFDDVQLLDGYSTNMSRSDISTQVKGIKLPIFCAPMSSICSEEVGHAFVKAGAVYIVDRYQSIGERFAHIKHILHGGYRDKPDERYDKAHIGVAVGLNDNLDLVYEHSYDFLKDTHQTLHLVIDVASFNNKRALQYLRNLLVRLSQPPIVGYPGLIKNNRLKLTIGNLSNSKDFMEAMKLFFNSDWEFEEVMSKIDYIKVSQGGGSMCSTRLNIGVGCPTFQAVIDLRKALDERNIKNVEIIADGGVKTSGDMVKAFGAGASAVMVGGMVAGHRECPGDIITVHGEKLMLYEGMASANAKKKYLGHTRNVEGGSTYKPLKECSLDDSLKTWKENIQSGVGTCGHSSLDSFVGQGQFIKVTASGVREASLHGSHK